MNRTDAKLDSVDWAILKILQNDATIPNKEIAARVGVAPSTCLERVRRLRGSGVIASVRAQVDPRRVGRPEQAFIAVQLRPHSREVVESFTRRITALPEAMALYNVSGVDDYYIHVAVADSTALQSLIIDRITTIPEVAHVRTQLIFGTPVSSPVQPLP